MGVARPNRGKSAAAVEWPTVLLIAACYGMWLGAGVFLAQDWLILSLLVLTVAIALQSSLMHEACHGHPTRRAVVNELLVGLPIGLVYPYRRFKALHLRHHADERLTDPFDDPESYYRALWKHEQLPPLAEAASQAQQHHGRALPSSARRSPMSGSSSRMPGSSQRATVR